MIVRAWLWLGLYVAGSLPAAGQAFEVASVKPSPHAVGPDYNNQLSVASSGFTAKNATLRRLIADAYGVQVRQVAGPGWLDENEYDIEARTAGPVQREALEGMLRTLLAERFELKQHGETREMGVYELVAGKSGALVEPGKAAKAGPGFHFQGTMRRFADFLAVQLSMPIPDDATQPGRGGGPMRPVLDRTGLEGTYDFRIDVRPELGADPLGLWRQALRAQLGLDIESRRGPVAVIVVDHAARVPTAN